MRIIICGSMAGFVEMKRIAMELEAKGHTVITPQERLEVPTGWNGTFGEYIEKMEGEDGFPADHEIWDIKQGAIMEHFKNIASGDVVLVVNPEKRGIQGYIGGNTLMEIGLACYLRKPIYLLYAPAKELSYAHEIWGTKPIVLLGDVEGML